VAKFGNDQSSNLGDQVAKKRSEAKHNGHQPAWPLMAAIIRFSSEMCTSYNALIRIRSFSVDATIVLDVLECLLHFPSYTSVVAVLAGAVNQVLFTQ